jgi:uncharacterized protein with NRDE domain
MCLAAIAIGQSTRFPWVLLSNRDEFFDRPAQRLGWWRPRPDAARILSGRDDLAGGTWLGLSESGHLALVTNVREPNRAVAGLPSRGELVLQWLLGQHDEPALRAAAEVPRRGFNLLTADLFGSPSASALQGSAWWLSNRSQSGYCGLGNGVYGLSNAALDTPWPKVRKIKERLAAALHEADSLIDLVAAGFAALGDRRAASDAELPRTGVPLERERQLSSAFIVTAPGAAGSAPYGTRCATVVVAEERAGGRVVHVNERSFDACGGLVGEAHGEVVERISAASR